MSRPQRDQESLIPGFTGRDFAKSRDSGTFRDGTDRQRSHPVASSKSVWVFSVAGNVVTQKSAYLEPEKVKACVIVKSNLGLLRDMGF